MDRGPSIAPSIIWPITRTLSLLGEYRYTHVQSEPVLRGATTGSSIPMRFTLNTHHVVAGLAVSF